MVARRTTRRPTTRKSTPKIKVLKGRVQVTKTVGSKRNTITGVWQGKKFYDRMGSLTPKGKRAVTSKVRLSGRKTVYGHVSLSKLKADKRR